MLCTADQIRNYLKSTLSVKRFLHCENVASTMSFLFDEFGPPTRGAESYEGMGVAEVVGLMHDAAREYSDERIMQYVSEHRILMPEEFSRVPVLAHGFVAHGMMQEMIGDVPSSWLSALDWHTTGNVSMGYIGMVLFVADFIEPGRRFLDDEQRKRYLSKGDLNIAASAILDDMIAHWQSKGIVPSLSSVELQRFLHDGNRIEKDR